MVGGIQLSGPYEPCSGGRLVLGLAYSRLTPSVQAVAYSQSLPADWVSHRLGLVPQAGPEARRWIAAVGPGSFAPSAVMGLLNTFRGPDANRVRHFLGECRHIPRRGGPAPPGTKALDLRPESPRSVLSRSERLSEPNPPGVRRWGKSPPEALTRRLSGMRGPLPGTKVQLDGAREADADADVSRREARGAGVLTERSAAERASTRRPEESLSAWSQEPARTRGRPAPQRRSALTRTPQGRRLPGARDGHDSDRGSKTRPRSAAKRSEGSGQGRQRVRKRHRQRKWSGSHIYIYSTTHTTRASFPRTTSGEGRECVWARARARGIKIQGALQAQTGDVVHGIGVLKLDIHHTHIWE